jgi:deoxyguanosine kinase
MAHIFSIEGNIGSGKSTLVRALKQHYESLNNNECKTTKIVFMEEPVSLWTEIKDASGENMIEKFYKDQHKYAFSFQMMAYISRLSMLKQCIRENPNSIIICERSLYTDKNVFAKMLYDENKIEEVNYQIYLKWFDEFVEDIPNSGIIYVKADPEISHARVEMRARQGENIPLSYLENCHAYHESWMKQEESDVLILDANDNKSTKTDYNLWIETIIRFITYRSKKNNVNAISNKTIEELSMYGC